MLVGHCKKKLSYTELLISNKIRLPDKGWFHLRRNRRRSRNRRHNTVGRKNRSENQIVRSGIGSLDMNLKPRHEVKKKVL